MKSTSHLFTLYLRCLSCVIAHHFFTGVLTAGSLASFLWPSKKSNYSLYHENHTKKPPTTTVNTVVKKIELHTKDGLVRPGVLTIRPRAKGNVILCHPASYTKEFLAPLEETIFHEYNCLKFDFRRHGEKSDNQYATLGKEEVQEIKAAIDLIKGDARIAHLPLFGFGISMGAVALIEAESQHPSFDGLILQAPFESISRQAVRTFGFFRIPPFNFLIFSPFTRWYAKAKYRIKLSYVKPARSIKKITTPVFLIHAKDDPTISFKAFKRLKKAGSCIVKTWTPDTGLHTALFKTWPEAYTHECKDFLTKLHSTFLQKKRLLKPFLIKAT